jgi:hypothetical protein
VQTLVFYSGNEERYATRRQPIFLLVNDFNPVVLPRIHVQNAAIYKATSQAPAVQGKQVTDTEYLIWCWQNIQ